MERLAHLLEKVCSDLYCHIRGKISALGCQLVAYPLRQLLEVILALVALIRENHLSIVVLGAEDASHALACLTHSIKRKKVLVSNLVILLQELHARSQVSTQCVLERYAKDYDTPTVVSCKVDAFGDFAACYGEENGATAIVTGLFVVFKGEHRLEIVLCLDENELVSKHSLQDAHLVPLDNDVLHILVAREEADEAVGDYPTQLDQKTAVVAHDTRVLSLVKLGTDGELVGSFRHYKRVDSVSWQVNLECSHDSRREVEHLGVDLHWRDRSRR